MKLTTILKSEHEQIKAMLEVLKAISTRLNEDQAVDPDHPVRVVFFLRNYADRLHHNGEIPLFDVMEQQLPQESGELVGQLTADHTLFRLLDDSMEVSSGLYASGEKSAGREFAATAETYGALIFHHICQEDNSLFKIAEQSLSQEARDKVDADSQKQRAEADDQAVQDCLKILDDLTSTYVKVTDKAAPK